VPRSLKTASFTGRFRIVNDEKTAVNGPYYPVILGTEIRYRIRCRIPRQYGPYCPVILDTVIRSVYGAVYRDNTVRIRLLYGPYFCARYYGSNTVRKRTVSCDLGETKDYQKNILAIQKLKIKTVFFLKKQHY
jgi:hypothetical protein